MLPQGLQYGLDEDFEWKRISDKCDDLGTLRCPLRDHSDNLKEMEG
jgi:hypothetical protein